MRILHLADRLSLRGGADWHLLGVLQHLTREHQVQLAVGRVDPEVICPCLVTRLEGLDARSEKRVDLDPLVDQVVPEVIHLHNIVNPFVLRWAAQRRALMTVQDHRAFCPGRGKWTATGEPCSDRMSRATCARCFDDENYFEQIFDVTRQRLQALKQLPLVVLSRYMKAELVRVGIPDERIFVIPPFVHGLDPRAEADGPPCMLFVGRLVQAKGALEAVTVWQRCVSDLPLVMVGTGALRQQLEQRGCQVLGWVSHERLSALYRRARVVLMPCRWQEPFGIVGLEALSMGAPVVAWDSGGVSEWCPPSGLLPWGDVEGMARLAGRIASRGEETRPSEGFARDALMARLARLYEQL